MKAGEELASALASTATNLTRRDQGACLQSLKSEVLADVKHLLDMESSAKSGFTEAKLIYAPLTFAITALVEDLLHHKNPVDKALKAAGETISKKLPFGTVVIAIGKDGNYLFEIYFISNDAA